MSGFLLYWFTRPARQTFVEKDFKPRNERSVKLREKQQLSHAVKRQHGFCAQRYYTLGVPSSLFFETTFFSGLMRLSVSLSPPLSPLSLSLFMQSGGFRSLLRLSCSKGQCVMSPKIPSEAIVALLFGRWHSFT